MDETYWPAGVEVQWIDCPQEPQRNVDLDAELGEAVGRGERPPMIRLWRAGHQDGIGVSRKDVATPAGQRAMAELQADGYAVVVRQTGGTAVPQGDGVLHVSYLFPRPAAGVTTDGYYRLLCQPLTDWMTQQLGCRASIGSLPGSYCDGKYNVLASGRKLVGTAQAWRGGLAGMKSSRPGYVVAHASIVVDFDMQWATELINRFYTLAKDPYRVAGHTSTTLRAEVPERFAGMNRADAAVWSLERLADYYREVVLPR